MAGVSTSSESVKQTIERLLNIHLPDEYPDSCLAQMLELANQPPFPTPFPIQIPTISDHAYQSVVKFDPRLRQRAYLKQCYRERRRDVIDQCGLKLWKLDIVLDLDCTLVECIVPPFADSPFAVKQFQEKLKRETKRDVREFTIPNDHRPLTLLYTVRPGAESFLKKLTTIGNLYVYSQGKNDYVNAVLGSLRWRELFRGIAICPQERQKSLTERMRELSDHRENVLILDDQLMVWAEEDQDLVLPVMKYIPLYKHDQRHEESPKFEERLLQYSFDKTLPMYKEMNETNARGSFVESESGEQLSVLERMVRKIHECRFLDQYTRSASSYFKEIQARKFKGKSFHLSVSPSAPEGRDANLRFLLERMGGNLSETGGMGVVEIMDRDGAGMGEGDMRSQNYVLATYFKDVPRREN